MADCTHPCIPSSLGGQRPRSGIPGWLLPRGHLPTPSFWRSQQTWADRGLTPTPPPLSRGPSPRGCVQIPRLVRPSPAASGSPAPTQCPLNYLPLEGSCSQASPALRCGVRTSHELGVTACNSLYHLLWVLSLWASAALPHCLWSDRCTDPVPCLHGVSTLPPGPPKSRVRTPADQAAPTPAASVLVSSAQQVALVFHFLQISFFK